MDNGQCGFQLAQLVKSLIVEWEIWDTILVYTKNWLVSWSDDKELLSRADVIGWNSLKKIMVNDSNLWAWSLRTTSPFFEGLDSLVDVGGGTRTMARIISEAFPHMKCIVLDLPHVVANLPDGENLKYVSGDMFQSITSLQLRSY